MLKSATLILEQYIDVAHWFKFHWFEQIRIDVEEFAYICNVNSRWFIVYETDFLVADLPKVADEMAYILDQNDLIPLHWLVKKSRGSTMKSSPLDTATEHNQEAYDMLIYQDPETTLRYAVLEAKPTPARQPTSNPLVYGGSEPA